MYWRTQFGMFDIFDFKSFGAISYFLVPHLHAACLSDCVNNSTFWRQLLSRLRTLGAKLAENTRCKACKLFDINFLQNLWLLVKVAVWLYQEWCWCPWFLFTWGAIIMIYLNHQKLTSSASKKGNRNSMQWHKIDRRHAQGFWQVHFILLNCC